jgi:hypothetical protein
VQKLTSSATVLGIGPKECPKICPHKERSSDSSSEDKLSILLSKADNPKIFSMLHALLSLNILIIPQNKNYVNRNYKIFQSEKSVKFLDKKYNLIDNIK